MSAYFRFHDASKQNESDKTNFQSIRVLQETNIFHLGRSARQLWENLSLTKKALSQANDFSSVFLFPALLSFIFFQWSHNLTFKKRNLI